MSDTSSHDSSPSPTGKKSRSPLLLAMLALLIALGGSAFVFIRTESQVQSLESDVEDLRDELASERTESRDALDAARGDIDDLQQSVDDHDFRLESLEWATESLRDCVNGFVDEYIASTNEGRGGEYALC